MRLTGYPYLILICITAGLGGFLFGFDTAVISGAINFLRAQFSLTPVMEGWLMSSALLGCVGGAASAGWMSDRYGRKVSLLLSAFLFIISALWCAVAQAPFALVIARIVGGAGVGIAAMVAPLFISELSPAYLRGRLVSVYQLSITLGILCSYLSNGWLLGFATRGAVPGFLHYYMVEQVWRAMLGSNMVPALLFFLLLLLAPESPRWLVMKKKYIKASDVLTRINGLEAARVEMAEIKKAINIEEVNIKELFARQWRTALFIGIMLPFFSQLSGITTVMYYAPTIFAKAGFEGSSAMGNAALIGFFNMIFTLVAIWKIDVWGRKPLLMFGFIGLSVALFVIGWLFYKDGNSTFFIGSFILYIAVFAATLGPGVWVVIAEIYPTKIRGRAMSLATLILFTGSAFVTQTYPILRESVGIGFAFMLYAAAMLPGAWFVYKFIPETKGKTLEEIEHYWESNHQENINSKVINH